MGIERAADGRERIVLYRDCQGWKAIFSDPTIKELFGTDTIPTAFTKNTSKSKVLAEIQKMNPNDVVEAWGQENLGDYSESDSHKMYQYIMAIGRKG